MGFLQLTTEGLALTSAPGISIQPWKCPLSLLTCGMNVLPYKPPKLIMPCTIPCQTPKGHLNSMRGLVGPNPPHVKDCDNICWHLTTIFAGPGASMFAAKFVDNICQSASQVFASLAHPSAADNHTLSDGPRHGPIHGPEHPTDQYALCCSSKLFDEMSYL